MDINEIIKNVKSLSFPPGSYAIFGSGPMAAHGIRESHDIDLIVTQELWDKLKLAGWEEKFLDNNSPYLVKNHVEAYNDWSCSSYNPNIAKLIPEAEIIDGVPFVQLKEVLAWKKAQGREKDLADIKIIEDYLKEQ